MDRLGGKWLHLRLAIVAAAISLGGCAGVMNPFQQEFACPQTSKGKCISLKDAYLEDLSARSPGESDDFVPDDTIKAADEAAAARRAGAPSAIEAAPSAVAASSVKGGDPRHSTSLEYRDAANRKVAKLLRDPVTPVVAPPQVMRVLILPYEDDETALNLMRYSYIMVDRPKWVLGSYLAKEEESGGME